MIENNTEKKAPRAWKVWPFILGGAVLTGLCGLVVIAALVLGLVIFRSETTVQATASSPDARAVLTVAPDGCGVNRTEVEGLTPVRSLTWVITDVEGFSVLERNAEGEYRYRYFRDGQYRVQLKAWYGDRYHPVSNEVAITCSK